MSKVVELRQKGKTFTEIGKELGFSKQYANFLYIKETGIKNQRLKYQILKRIKYPIFKELYREGITPIEIAEKLELDTVTIRKYFYGKVKIPFNVIIKLRDLYRPNLSIDEFMKGE